jgi:hypothetical protein
MNIDEITRIAREAGFVGFDGKNKTLAKFAALVAAHEREECAKVCEVEADDGTEGEWDGCCLFLAGQIRARSNT